MHLSAQTRRFGNFVLPTRYREKEMHKKLSIASSYLNFRPLQRCFRVASFSLAQKISVKTEPIRILEKAKLQNRCSSQEKESIRRQTFVVNKIGRQFLSVWVHQI